MANPPRSWRSSATSDRGTGCGYNISSPCDAPSVIDDRSLVDASISHKLGTMPAWTPAISTVVCTSNIQQFGLLGADVTQLLVKFYRRASQPIELPPGVNLQVLPPELVQTVYGALIRGIEEMIETGEQTRTQLEVIRRSED